MTTPDFQDTVVAESTFSLGDSGPDATPLFARQRRFESTDTRGVGWSLILPWEDGAVRTLIGDETTPSVDQRHSSETTASDYVESGDARDVDAAVRARNELLDAEDARGELPKEQSERLRLLTQRVRQLLPAISKLEMATLEAATADMERLHREGMERRRLLGMALPR